MDRIGRILNCLTELQRGIAERCQHAAATKDEADFVLVLRDFQQKFLAEAELTRRLEEPAAGPPADEIPAGSPVVATVRVVLARLEECRQAQAAIKAELSTEATDEQCLSALRRLQDLSPQRQRAEAELRHFLGV